MVEAIFSDVRYFLSLSIRPERREQLAEVLDQAGATAVSLEDSTMTHFITMSLPTEDSLELLPEDNRAALVTPTWIERSCIIGSPQPPEFYSPDPSLLFSGITATATDLSKSDMELLSAAIAALGGQWRSSLVREVTHVFALTTGSQQYETAMYFREKSGMVILVPHWFDDSVRLGVRGLPTQEYEWPEPAVFKGGFNTDKEGAIGSGMEKSYRIPREKKPFFETALATGNELPPKHAPPGNVWKGLRVLLSATLGLTESQRNAHEADIIREGGQVIQLTRVESGSANEIAEEEAEKVEEADIFVTKYRAGAAYVRSYKAGKTIGTLAWLWYCRASGALSRPTDQLLHYPIPKKLIEGFSSHRITITNYTGKHRDYLKKLITIMGAEFTPSMSTKNTAVVAAYIAGNKTEKAVSWSIPVVNHTWLEDCFVQWRALTPAHERYIIFPPNVDFSKLLAERRTGGQIVFELGELDALELDNDIYDEEEVASDVAVPSGTANSAREVEDAVAFEEGLGDVSIGGLAEVELRIEDDPMNVDGDGGQLRRQVPAKAPVTSRAKTTEPSPRDQDEEDEIFGGAATLTSRASKLVRRYGQRASTGRSTLPRGSDAEEEGNLDGRHESPVRPLKRRSRPAHAEQEDQGEIRASDVRAGTRKRKSLPPMPTQDDDEMDVDMDEDTNDEARPSGKSKYIVRTGPPSRRGRTKRVSTQSEDEHGEDDGNEDIVQARRPPKSTVRSARSRSAVSESIEPSTASRASSPSKPPPLRKRRVSVVVPTVAAVYSSPSRAGGSPKKSVARTASLRAEAAEALIRSREKRGRPSTSIAKPTRLDRTERQATPPPAKSRRKSAPSAPEQPVAGPSKAEIAVALARTPSKRSAANKATQKLRDEIMPDVINFQREIRRGNVRGAWEGNTAKGKEVEVGDAKRKSAKGKGKKRTSIAQEDMRPSEDEEEPEKKRQRKQSAAEEPAKAGTKAGDRRRSMQMEEEDGSQEEENPALKSRHKPASGGRDDSKAKNRNVRIMTTQISISDEVIRALVRLGAKMTTKPAECTHLVAKSLVRTEKFLCAMAVAPFIVSEKWLLACAATKQLLPEDQYLLSDPENEKKYGFKLADAIARARANGGKLFEGMTFYVTPKVPIDMKLLKNVVTAGGGQLVTQTPTVRILSGHENRHVVSSPSDIAIWRPLAEHGHAVYNQELILTGTLRQEIDWDSPANRVSGSNDA